jgi:AraC family transcriptional regulator
MRPEGLPQLGYGDFFGKQLDHRLAAGFCLSEREPEAWGPELPEHTHREAHFILLLQGQYASTAIGAPAVCRNPILIYNPPGVVHRDRFEASKGRFLGLSISMDRYRQLQALLSMPTDAIALGQPALISIARHLRREHREHDEASNLVIEGLCLELVGKITRRVVRMRRKPSWLASAQELLHNQSNVSRLGSTEIAMQLGVSPTEVVTGFRSHLGCSPGSYLRGIRMERARELLVRTNLSLAEVALAAGYADQSSFTKAFARIEGCPPGVYRKQGL